MNQRIRTRALSVFAVAAALALANPQDAHAYQGVSAFTCHVAQHDWPHTVATSLNGLENRSGDPGSRNMIVACPVVNDSRRVTSAWVAGVDGNNELSTLGELRVQACSNRSDGGDFACSTTQTLRIDPSVVFVGATRFPLNAGILGELNFFEFGHRYLNISIPRPGAAGFSRLIGYEVFS